MNCVCAGSWEKVTEFPKEGDCGAFSSFCRHVVAAISSALFLSKQRRSLGLGQRFGKATEGSSFSFPRRHLLLKSK